jgi:hypothetical protein
MCAPRRVVQVSLLIEKVCPYIVLICVLICVLTFVSCVSLYGSLYGSLYVSLYVSSQPYMADICRLICVLICVLISLHMCPYILVAGQDHVAGRRGQTDVCKNTYKDTYEDTYKGVFTGTAGKLQVSFHAAGVGGRGGGVRAREQQRDKDIERGWRMIAPADAFAPSEPPRTSPSPSLLHALTKSARRGHI